MPLERVRAIDIPEGVRIVDDHLDLTPMTVMVTESSGDLSEPSRFVDIMFAPTDGTLESLRLPADAQVWVTGSDEDAHVLTEQHRPEGWPSGSEGEPTGDADGDLTEDADVGEPVTSVRGTRERDPHVQERFAELVRSWDPKDPARRAEATEIAWLLAATGDRAAAGSVIALAVDAHRSYGEQADADELAGLDVYLVGRVRGRRARAFRKAREGLSPAVGEDPVAAWRARVDAMAAAIRRADTQESGAPARGAFLDAYRNAVWAWLIGIEGEDYDPPLIAQDIAQLEDAIRDSFAP